MINVSSVEKAYEVIAEAAVEFPAGRSWNSITAIYEIWPKMISAKWKIRDGESEDRKGKAPSEALRTASMDAVAYLRDDLLRTTGDRIWGMTFTLFPDGRFDIAYDYIKPDGYLEDDEYSDATHQDVPDANVLGGLVKVNMTGNASESLCQSPGSREALRLQTALVWLQERTSAESKVWAIGTEENWNADLNEGWLRWTFADGRVMQAEVQVVGTYNTANGTFLWGWDHPSVPEPLRRAAKLAQALGAKENFLRLTSRTVACTEDEAWQFTALAAQLDDATGAYRGNANGTWVYMAYGRPVDISKSV